MSPLTAWTDARPVSVLLSHAHRPIVSKTRDGDPQAGREQRRGPACTSWHPPVRGNDHRRTEPASPTRHCLLPAFVCLCVQDVCFQDVGAARGVGTSLVLKQLPGCVSRRRGRERWDSLSISGFSGRDPHYTQESYSSPQPLFPGAIFASLSLPTSRGSPALCPPCKSEAVSAHSSLPTRVGNFSFYNLLQPAVLPPKSARSLSPQCQHQHLPFPLPRLLVLLRPQS